MSVDTRRGASFPRHGSCKREKAIIHVFISWKSRRGMSIIPCSDVALISAITTDHLAMALFQSTRKEKIAVTGTRGSDCSVIPLRVARKFGKVWVLYNESKSIRADQQEQKSFESDVLESRKRTKLVRPWPKQAASRARRFLGGYRLAIKQRDKISKMAFSPCACCTYSRSAAGQSVQSVVGRCSR